MTSDKNSNASANKNTPTDKSISIGGDIVDSVVIAGNNNVVNKQTIIQKIINFILPTESETLEHRNRRILLGHVENAWIKGVLDASLHGAALLDLGIKEDPEAVTKYPWAIKKESTDETLPAGTSMLEIFGSIGMGRSLLILGAPGSGKTTMLLELARQLIARAREDVTQPIPMVFNLASWTEKLTLADWLAQELNNLYSVPRKTAPDWVKRDKLLLLLDGLDEVRQESRTKCVEAINAFRKEHGLTSLAVCSRSQDYADLNAKLAFEGAIEVQPLTQDQIVEFFKRYGDETSGIKQAFEKDSSLREMAETPLFLSVMLMAYRGKQDVRAWVSEDKEASRKNLFNTYIERIFDRRSENAVFKKKDVLHWLSWLASKMIKHHATPYLFEDMQSEWLGGKRQHHKLISGLIVGLINGAVVGFFCLSYLPTNITTIGASISMLSALLLSVVIFWRRKISTIDSISWTWKNAKRDFLLGLFIGLLIGLIGEPYFGLIIGAVVMFLGRLRVQRVEETTFPGQRLVFTAKNFVLIFLIIDLFPGLITFALVSLDSSLDIDGQIFLLGIGMFWSAFVAIIIGLIYGGATLIQHYTLRLILSRNNLLPWKLIPFLDHCVDLIFLRRVGGGYIFVHRLLMEHFAEMYVESPTSKGKQK